MRAMCGQTHAAIAPALQLGMLSHHISVIVNPSPSNSPCQHNLSHRRAKH